MLTRIVCVHAAATVIAMATLVDQQRPDFHGQWALDERRTKQAARDQESHLASGGDAIMDTRPRAARLHLKVDATSLTMTSEGTQDPPVQTWTLDGVDRSPRTDVRATAEWRGRAIEIQMKFKGSPPIRTELSMDGAWLVIKDTQKDRDAGKDTAWRSRRTYYTRVR
jgi:hypothetical protein